MMMAGPRDSPASGGGPSDQGLSEPVFKGARQNETEVHEHAEEQNTARHQVDPAGPPLPDVKAVASEPAEEEAEEEHGRPPLWRMHQQGIQEEERRHGISRG